MGMVRRSGLSLIDLAYGLYTLLPTLTSSGPIYLLFFSLKIRNQVAFS